MSYCLQRYLTMLEAKYVVADLAKNAHKLDSSKFNATYRFLAFLKKRFDSGLYLVFCELSCL